MAWLALVMASAASFGSAGLGLHISAAWLSWWLVIALIADKVRNRLSRRHRHVLITVHLRSIARMIQQLQKVNACAWDSRTSLTVSLRASSARACT